MLRRIFNSFGLLAFVPLDAEVEPTPVKVNKFADAYNVWIEQVRTRKEGTLSASEVFAWAKVKEEWRRLAKFVDEYYNPNK